MAKASVAYDESAIKTLDSLQHIRLRTGMYIGRIGDGSHPLDGIYVMLKEVIDNSIDEFIMGEGRQIDVTLEDGTITVRDYGRGIPPGKLKACVSQINTGGKFNDDVFQFSVGLNGVGTKAVNALSSEFEAISYRDKRFKRVLFRQGKLIKETKGAAARARTGTHIAFTPDPEIFGDCSWNNDYIETRLRYYSYLNSGLCIEYNGKRFKSSDGLADLLRHEIGDEPTMYDIAYCKEAQLEFAFTHTPRFGENYFSFVNGQYTNDGGTHQSAFREGFLKAINEFSGKSFAGEDVREGMVGAVAIRLQDPVFESQTKNKLGSTEVRSVVVPEVKRHVLRWLHSHDEAAKQLLEKVKNNQRLRKELSAIKKEARERARKVAIRIPKLTDCKVHLNDNRGDKREETTIFITEGDSAGGAMVHARDVFTQAVYSLKGKPLNCYGLKRDAIYKNAELYNVMRALGIEDGLEGLRYNRVVIATDADVDGMHIRNLMLTYFLHFFEELVTHGHIYFLETPLFRVRNKKQTLYCYSEAERDEALDSISNPEVTRFKGLGEISPGEFKQFISEGIRLVAVSVHSMREVTDSLEFFMGKNSPKRRQFIVDNLMTDVV